jgi:hypothetical protein
MARGFQMRRVTSIASSASDDADSSRMGADWDEDSEPGISETA